MDTMFREANKNINIVTTAEGLNELYSSHFEVLKKANEKGVNIKIATSGTEKCADAIKAFSDFAEVRSIERHSQEVPIGGRFAVVDSKQMVMSLTPHKTHETQHMAIWSRSEHAAGEVL